MNPLLAVASDATPPSDERVIVLAPLGNEPPALAALLASGAFGTALARDGHEAAELLRGGAGALLATEEALALPWVDEAIAVVREQPAWSEIPIIILTAGGPARTAPLLERTDPRAGSIVVLERQIEPDLLLRAVRVALSSRRRQYQVRDLLEEQRRRRAELEEAKQAADRELEWRRQAEAALSAWIEEPTEFELRSRLARHGLAALVMTAGVAVRAAFDPVVGDGFPFSTLFGAVAVIVWLTGMWPAIWTAAVGYLVFDWLFSPPRYVLTHTVSDAYGFALAGIGISLIIAIGVRMRRAQGRARAGARLAMERQRHAERALEARDRAELKAREADERLRVAIKSSRFVLAECDREARYRWIYDPHGAFGPLGNVIGKRDGEVDDSDSGRRLLELKQRVISTGRGAVADLTFTSPDGLRTYAFTIEPLRDAAGEIAGATTAALDITDRKRAEEALRESEELFRALAENVPQLAWMARPDGSTFWYNRRWFDYTGTTLVEMQGSGWQQVLHPEHVERVTAGFQRAITKGSPWEDTFPLRAADGHYRWFLSRAFPIREANGRISRWFGTNTDITVLRKTEDALREAQQQIRQYADKLEKTVAERTAKLQETVQELEAFSYSIAHDMRAPLRSMIGYAEIVREEHAATVDAEGRDYLGRIAVSARRLDRLIQDILNYSRIVREEMPLEAVDVSQLILEVIDSYPDLSEAREHIQVDPELPPVRANRAALTQVVSNLLQNAVKFVPAGTAPRVTVRGERLPAAGVSPEGVGGRVQIWVEDNGIGIEPSVRPRLFQMFQRFTRPGLYEGTGIGLAIVRKAVDRMGGTIGVESEVGKGSRFWFVLPSADQNERTADPL